MVLSVQYRISNLLIPKSSRSIKLDGILPVWIVDVFYYDTLTITRVTPGEDHSKWGILAMTPSWNQTHSPSTVVPYCLLWQILNKQPRLHIPHKFIHTAHGWIWTQNTSHPDPWVVRTCAVCPSWCGESVYIIFTTQAHCGQVFQSAASLNV